MKKFILGISFFIGGIIGFVGWMIACTTKVQPGARSTVLGCMNGTDTIIAILFVAMIVVGLYISMIESEKQ